MEIRIAAGRNSRTGGPPGPWGSLALTRNPDRRFSVSVATRNIPLRVVPGHSFVNRPDGDAEF